MVTVFVIVFLIMIISVVIMAIGVLNNRKPIKGSCGGLNNVGVERACGCTDTCSENTNLSNLGNKNK